MATAAASTSAGTKSPASKTANAVMKAVPRASTPRRNRGEWQRFDVVFRAPRFDAQGNKTANAEFIRVQLNGVLIHEKETVSGPTRSALYKDEVSMGPLMFQGRSRPRWPIVT